MSYNYDPDYLQQNVEMVRTLVKAWKDGETLERVVESSKDAEKLKHHVRQLLASLAFNYPDDYGSIREDMRTWVRGVPGGLWTLYVGRGFKGMRGRPTDRFLRNVSNENPFKVTSNAVAHNVERLTEPKDFSNLLYKFDNSKDARVAKARSTIEVPEQAHQMAQGLGITIEQEPLSYGGFMITLTKGAEVKLSTEQEESLRRIAEFTQKYKTNRS